MNKSSGRAFTSGHQSPVRKVTHAPAVDSRINALCGLTNTQQVVRNDYGHVNISGRSLDIWKGDKAERMVTCQKCRKEMGL